MKASRWIGSDQFTTAMPSGSDCKSIDFSLGMVLNKKKYAIGLGVSAGLMERSVNKAAKSRMSAGTSLFAECRQLAMSRRYYLVSAGLRWDE